MRAPKTLQAESLDFWKRTAPICEKLGTLTEADRDTFTLLCQLWGRLSEAIATNAGSIEVVCLTKQWTNLAKLFGLDPVSRKKLGIDQDDQEPDEFGIGG